MSAIVETRDLTRRYGSMVALEHLNLEVPQGAIFGFIGPNGAGKTTTMRILTTLLTPSGGEAWVAGHSVTKDPLGVRKVVGFMPDFFGVYDNMKVWEYLDFFGRSYGVSAARRATLIGELLSLVDLSHKHDAFVMTLSRGMKQRLSLARTMIHDPALLILDEPASGLDPRARIELRELLKELRSLGKTVMISSHILTELAEMCTHIAIIERGHLLAAGDVQTILRSLQPHRTLELRILEGGERAEALLRGHNGVLAVRRDETATMPPAPAAAADPALESAAESETDQPEAAIAIADPAAESVSNPLQPLTLLIDYAGDERGMGELLKLLVASDVVVTRFAEQSSDLEDIFMQVTKGIVQ